MSHNDQNTSRLSPRDKELAAIGAAIASNCVPCVEYHIPQARRAGLSDSEIREAVELADRVRKVPADKVLQTAFALLEERPATHKGKERDACGCSEGAKDSKDGAGRGTVESDPKDWPLDKEGSREDNNTQKESPCDDLRASANAPGPDEAGGGPRNKRDQTGFAFSKMMEMMQRCCPDRMKDFSSMMSDFGAEHCPPDEEGSSEQSP